ncbi:MULTISPECIES: LuxR family transcriptional regulator [Streptomycetaceae]|uniref:Transcriptional regulator, LuxR family protein n=1 Tax=Streptantibioticus cattleyicolor (strain ATCC 35852 / DSM 46488 / JCM 4925 / NBRC 14057 / NRRL 8057) TaxID=1003195 RepID=F8JRE3_STREN|nr:MULTISPECIES: LuxR family transcriptional regulator [Streptomycetaceae]AEW96643.1 transcriptional regulator, LuxR family protein [Streptantibioticus cattleyicolor NRRL 8057 = DSM 46488]MYS61136.1 LuxR family transcriptional regulator [Streptomyces sp. SID5468]CCB76981.1 putative LuxR family regulator [Streptantibioticus cattleyicolor NRRL 8057 = DSM 46488]
MKNVLEKPERTATGTLPDPPAADPGYAVDELAVRVYEQTLTRGLVTAVQVATVLGAPFADTQRAMDRLRELRLVRYCPREGGFMAVSPEAAQVELIVPLEQAIHAKRRELAGIHEQLRSFADTFSNLRRTRLRQEAIVRHQDRGQLELRLADAARHCSSGILAMQPLAPGQVQEFEPFGLKVVERGVDVRVLYPHTARTSPVTRAGLSRVAAAGARVRTANHVFDHLVVVGDEVAFVPDRAAGRPTPAVTVVYEPSVVSLLRGIFEYAWQSGTDYDQDGGTYRETLDDVKATILDLLATGLKDDVVARRVGMSSRTFRRHLAGIMIELRAESRFQAGVAAARAGLVGLREGGTPVRPAC